MYQVEQFTVCDGWVNTWHDDGKPLLFKTWPNAVYALAEFYSGMAEAYEDGHVDTPIKPNDYRITEVKNDL